MEDEDKVQAARILSQTDRFIADLKSCQPWYTAAGRDEEYNAMIASMADVKQQLALQYNI